MLKLIAIVSCVLLAGVAYARGHLPEGSMDTGTPEGLQIITDDNIITCRTLPGIKGYIEALGEKNPLMSVNRRVPEARCEHHKKTLAYTAPRLVDEETVEFSDDHSGWTMLQRIQYLEVVLVPGGKSRYTYLFRGDPDRIPIVKSQ